MEKKENEFLSKEQIKKGLGRFKGLGIFASIILILIGLVITLFPLFSAIIGVWLFFAGLLIFGIYQIVTYCLLKKGERQGWQLASGILSLCLSVLTVFSTIVDINYLKNSGAEYPIASASATIVFWLFIFIGFSILFSGIFRLCNISKVVSHGGSKGWEIAYGIVSIVLGALMVTVPTYGVFIVFMYVGAAYIIILGIYIIIELCTNPELNGAHEKKIKEQKAHTKNIKENEDIVEESIIDAHEDSGINDNEL